MTPDEATWVHDRVLPGWYRRNALLSSRCACQGLCGHCAAGRHERCAVREWRALGLDRWSRPWKPIHSFPETHVVGRDGAVASTPTPGDGAVATVWLAPRPCRMRCTCPCPPELHPDLPPAARAPRDAGGNAGLDSTPRRQRADDQEPLPGLEMEIR